MSKWSFYQFMDIYMDITILHIMCDAGRIIKCRHYLSFQVITVFNLNLMRYTGKEIKRCNGGRILECYRDPLKITRFVGNYPEINSFCSG